LASGIKKLAGQTVIYGLGTILPRFLNYLLTPVLTIKAFTPAEYGINSEIYAYISFLNVIFTYGMETTFFNFNSKLDNKKEVFNTALTSLLLSSIVFSLLLIAFSSSIAGALSTPNAVYSTQFIIWSVLIIATDAIMTIPFANMRAENKALQFSLLKLSNVIINFGLTIFYVKVCRNAYLNNEDNFFASFYNPEIGIGYTFLANLIANVFTLVFLSRQFLALSFKFNMELLKEMLSYAWPLIILGLAGMVNETLDRIILKKLMTDKSAAQNAQGIYGACYKIAILMTIFIQAFRYAAEPFFFGKAKEKDSQKSYAVIMKYFVIFCLFLFLGTAMNLDWIQYFIGVEFRKGISVVPILLLANLCLGVVYNLSIWYKLSGQTKYGAVIAIVGAVITITINVIFVPEYSYVACAWATLAAYASMMILSYILGQKYFPIRYNLRAMFVYTFLSLGLYFVSFIYGGMENTFVKVILNNLLVILFAWLVYKLEISNLKKLRANVSKTNS
jgi:O-antigen/teichoic acid export membrane protein